MTISKLTGNWIASTMLAGIIVVLCLILVGFVPAHAQASNDYWGCWLTDGGKCNWNGEIWGGSSAEPSAGDVNGDGKADRILFYRNSGDWGCRITGGGKCSWDGEVWGGNQHNLFDVADVNGDGKVDRIIYNASSGDWGCRITGGGKCSWDGEIWGGSSSGSTYSGLLGDLNGDGKADRILYHYPDGVWGCRITDGGKCDWDGEIWGGLNEWPLMGDVNGDGKADRMLRSRDGVWGCRITNGSKCNWDGEIWGGSPYGILVGDVNGDRKADRILYSPYDEGGQSKGEWRCRITDVGTCNWDTRVWGGHPYWPQAGDVNGDGKADRILFLEPPPGEGPKPPPGEGPGPNPGAADLAISAHWISLGIVHAGEPFQYYVNYGNIGGTATGTFVVHFYLDGAFEAEFPAPSFAPGTGDTAWKTYSGLSVGDHTLGVCLDANNVVPEQYESNNCTYYGLKVWEPFALQLLMPFTAK